MTLFKSFLLGTAAFVATSATVFAADMDRLPPLRSAVAPAINEPGPVDPPPPPAECKKGYYKVFQTDTCMKVGGLIRAYAILQPENIDVGGTKGWLGDPGQIASDPTHNDIFSIAAVGRVNFDSVTKTSMGDLRGFIEIGGNAGSFVGGAEGTTLGLRHAYMTLAGWTLGHTQSFFNGGDGALGGFAGPAGDFDPSRRPLIGYTAELSKEFKLNVSAESHDYIDGKDVDGVKHSGILFAVPAGSAATHYNNDASYIPDLVANLIGEFDWGNFGVSGAAGQYRFYDAGSAGTYEDEFLGWAVGAGATFKLDGLAKGDAWQAKFGYADGATMYLGSSDDAAIIDGIGPDFGVETTVGFTAETSLLHNWSPTWNSTFYTGYAGAQRTTNADTASLVNGQPISQWNVGANLTWQPHANFNIGGDIYFANVVRDNVDTGVYADSAFGGLLRAQRTF